MSDGGDSKSSWARYIETATKRPGWNVARLAREAQVHRSTVFRWRSGEGGAVTVESVRRIAQALGDDPNTALRAAGDLIGGGAQAAGGDEELDLIMRAPVDDQMKARMVEMLLQRRERERQQRIADFQALLEEAARARGDG